MDGSNLPLENTQDESSSSNFVRRDYTNHEKPIKDVGVILQSLCHLHRWTRTASDLGIYERSERLRSVRLGIAVAYGRLRGAAPHLVSKPIPSEKGKEKALEVGDQAAALEDLLSGLSINHTSTGETLHEGYPFSIHTTARRLSLSASAGSTSSAVSLAHGVAYVPQLLSYISGVATAHTAQESEVPPNLSQGDLYLCDKSLEALEGALGACCEGIDQVCAEGKRGIKRFISVRPPGHHCETETPMGFCWLNNIAVAATYAYLEHDIDRVVIFDIDLHHGNGTQQIVWRLNATAHREHLQAKKAISPKKSSPKKPAVRESYKRPLQLYYGSLHDINSYPCEDLDASLIANASVNISGGGGSQYVTNVHLESYPDNATFHRVLYPSYRDTLFKSAQSFLAKSHAEPRNTLILISAGFDACEFEYATMSRHGAKVPTGFFSRFAKEASEFADKYAQGRMMSVLEGGYSQRALLTGVGSYMAGLVDNFDYTTHEDWWDSKGLSQSEKLLAVVPNGSAGARAKAPLLGKKTEAEKADWMVDAKAILEKMEMASPESILASSNGRPGATEKERRSGVADILAATAELANERTMRSRSGTPSGTPFATPSNPLTGRVRRPPNGTVAPAPPSLPYIAPSSLSSSSENEDAPPQIAVRNSKHINPSTSSSTLIDSPLAVKPEPQKPTLIKFTFKAAEEQRLDRESVRQPTSLIGEERKYKEQEDSKAPSEQPKP